MKIKYCNGDTANKILGHFTTTDNDIDFSAKAKRNT